ncbi:hypothetical protein LTR03_014645 [Friedmanniomyces endolithicus]|nr:hypothetical protein LTR03_014645 [Friedmanniomyces endolithicus]
MAAGLQETHPQPISTRCAGVKRNRALEAHTPRKTARFDNSHQEQLVFSKGSKGADCYTSRQNTGEEKGSVRAHQKTSSRKRLKCGATKQHPTIVMKSIKQEEFRYGVQPDQQLEQPAVPGAEERRIQQVATYPKDTLFGDDLFKSTCENVQDRNETRVIRDIALLIVPSAEIFATRGATNLQYFAVGFRREAFAQHQLDRMHPVVGDFNDQSFFMATWYMYFPFLTCEVKCGAAALDIADRQNAHSTAIAVRGVVELFRAVKREKELHREILAFSVSHDQRSVRIYGYYAEIGESETKYYRHAIHTFDFTALDGKERWTAYKFTKNVYDHWMPIHFKRICSAIEQIPAGISFSESQSELHFSEETGLSQDISAYSIARSSASSISAQGEDARTSCISQDATATPGTSVDGGAVFKKPRKGTVR